MKSILNRNLVFVHGKGGVGKTVVSEAIAIRQADSGAKTLWITIEDPTRPRGIIQEVEPNLWHLNCDFTLAFEEYAALKIGAAKLTQIFLKNKLMRYLAKAAPGVHELVLLGKIWFERTHYTHVVVDLPSTGYGLAMFQSTDNFVRLFKGGPLYRDAVAMLETFRNPQATGHLIVSLPEEMPLRESLELKQHLQSILPENPPAFLVNRVFPPVKSPETSFEGPESKTRKPLAESAEDYANQRYGLERHNLRIWRDEKIAFQELGFLPPPPQVNITEKIAHGLAKQLKEKGYL